MPRAGLSGAAPPSLERRLGPWDTAAIVISNVIGVGIFITTGFIATLQPNRAAILGVWTLGGGLGFGRYPRTEGIWEAGHCVVTLDPKERFCGCGGVGHLEGILGHHAIETRPIVRARARRRALWHVGRKAARQEVIC